MRALAFVAVLSLLAVPVFSHEGGKDNCRVTLQTYYKDGKRKVDVLEFHVDSHEQCRSEAGMKKAAVEASADDEAYRVNMIFAYRGFEDFSPKEASY